MRNNRIRKWGKFCRMDKDAVQNYTMELAESARSSLRLTKKEFYCYQHALVDAINYFNDRDEAHAEYMNYLKELRESTPHIQKGNTYQEW